MTLGRLRYTKGHGDAVSTATHGAGCRAWRIQVEASAVSSVVVVWPRGATISIPQMRWLSVVLATRRFETLKSSELRFESRTGFYNNDWTGDTNNTSGERRTFVASRVRILMGLMRRSRLQRTTTTLD